MVSPKRWASALALTCMGVPAAAFAQEAPAEPTPAEAAPASAETSMTLGASASTETGTAAEADAQASASESEEPAASEEESEEATGDDEPKEPEAATEDTDHEGVVGRFGVGLLGGTTVSFPTSGFGTQDVNLPILGARYWMNERLGLQAGLGLAHSSGDNGRSDARSGFDTQTLWGMALHVGAPIVFFYDEHYKFLVQPEANFLFGTGRLHDNLNTTADEAVQMNAWGLDLGARVGAEVHFGFIGIPKLSLQGSIGAHYTLRQGITSNIEGGRQVDHVITRHTLGTAHFSDPWDLFTSSIAALYYF